MKKNLTIRICVFVTVECTTTRFVVIYSNNVVVIILKYCHKYIQITYTYMYFKRRFIPNIHMNKHTAVLSALSSECTPLSGAIA